MKTIQNGNLGHILANPTYTPRVYTDCLFEAATAYAYEGEADRAARFIEEAQLLNEELWSVFVEQFRIQPDGKDKFWRGEYWGKMMRGGCWTYKYTKNAALYAVLRKTVEEMLSLQAENGRISAYKQELEFDGWDMWCRKYVLLGMQYFYDICEDGELRAKVLHSICRQANYIMDHVGEGEGKTDILQTTVTEWFWGGMNSASILEPFVRLYNLTQDKKYLDFAAYIIKTGGCAWGNVFKTALEGKKLPFEYPVTKAYETMSFFEGVLEYYRVTGDEDCRRAALNFIDGVFKSDVTIIGCCGCLHELFDNSAIKQTEPPTDQVMQETCVSVTWMKLCYQALCLTGEAKYADAIERTYYNAMLGSVNFNKNPVIGTNRIEGRRPEYALSDDFVRALGGFPFDSYSPLYKSKRNILVGGYLNMENGKSYGCCACIGAAGTALLPLSAIMLRKDGFAFNHYVQGTFTGNTPEGNVVRFRIATGYPYDGKIKIEWSCEAQESFKLALRIPSYVRDVLVDGQKTEAEPNTYLIKEIGGQGSVTLEFPLIVHATSLNGKVAVQKGCIVYAADERNQDLDAKASGSIVVVRSVKKEFPCRSALEVTFDNGETIKLVDYASAGAEWNTENCCVNVWLDC